MEHKWTDNDIDAAFFIGILCKTDDAIGDIQKALDQLNGVEPHIMVKALRTKKQ